MTTPAKIEQWMDNVAKVKAENERLREALMRLFQANSTASSAATLIAALEHAKAILNREQEKP